MEYDKERQLNELGDQLRKEYKEVIIDFIIYDTNEHKVLVQKRSMTRSLFPGEWEFPGGHLEPDESLAACLKRLVYEEGQMYLKEVVKLVHLFTWDSDKDVVNVQFLVNASGDFSPNVDKISEHRFIDTEGLDLLHENGQESPIYRGAFYAFEYLKMSEEKRLDLFESILFFDQMVAGFFDFLRIETQAPKVVIGKENEKKFSLDKEGGLLSIAPSFLRHYDKFGCASIILHLVFHNYRQNILTYDDVKAIRGIMGKNFMFYVDIVADVYTYLYFERHYSFTEAKYLELCGQLIQEYQADTLENSKFTRLAGALLTISERSGQGFDVVVPVLDGDKIHTMRFDRSLKYSNISIGKALYGKCADLMTKKKINEKDFVSTFEKLITLAKVGK
jgi:8-oxo-dGTP pyrophosphatase MutT (NUDIX family)